MTGRRTNKTAKGKSVSKQPQTRVQNAQNAQQQSQNQPIAAEEGSGSSLPSNIKKEQPAPPQVVKKILKTENDEAKTLKTVFKSNPDSQMKDFIKKAAVKPQQPAVTKPVVKTPAESHPPAVAQDLLDTDDDVADNLAKLFKTSKSYKNV